MTKTGLARSTAMEYLASFVRAEIAMSGGGFGGRLDMLPVAGLIGAAATLYKPFSGRTLRETVGRVVGAAATARGTPPESP